VLGLALYDFRTQQVPNLITLPLLVIALTWHFLGTLTQWVGTGLLFAAWYGDIHKYIGKEIALKERPNKEFVTESEQEFVEKINASPELKETKGVQLNREIMKLHINAGKKTKMRAVDIVGTLCNIKGMTAADIGIINIADISTFVEILNNKGELVYKELQNTPIKGRLRRVSKVDMTRS
jgi:hypothetical protein